MSEEAFANAVKETEQKQSVDVISVSKTSAAATPVELLPSSLQASIPSLRYQAHIYATEAKKRWIKINNRPLYEGDSLGALTVVEITPEQTRFDFDGIEFSFKRCKTGCLKEHGLLKKRIRSSLNSSGLMAASSSSLAF